MTLLLTLPLLLLLPLILLVRRFYHSEEYNLRDFILFNVSGDGCSNGADGGRFSGSGTVTMLSTRCRAAGNPNKPLPAGPGPSGLAPGSGDLLPLEECKGNVSARYTVDGSDPRSSSTAKTYLSPFAIAKTTTVMAVAVVGGLLRNLVHNASFVRHG